MNLSHSTPPMPAADPALPQRDLLLDEAVMKEYLSRLVARTADCSITGCERLRTKYRTGASLRVLYELGGGSRSYRIAARAYPRTQPVTNRFTSPVEIHASELNTVFWIFPHDRKIKNLSLLNQVPDELRAINGQSWVTSRIVGHAPEKSVTAQCLSESNNVVAYAKIYAGDEGRQFFDTYVHLASVLRADDLQVPRALGYSEKHRLLLLEPATGASLSALPSAQRSEAFLRLGKALKALHRTAPPASVSESKRFDTEALMRASATLQQVRPDLAALVQRLTTRLLELRDKCSQGRPVLLHGDVHAKNFLFDGDRVCLLDLDQAVIGVAAVDLGSVIAGLYCDSCVGSITWREASAATRAFLAGYEPLDSFAALQSLRWHTAAALLQERALRAVTRIRANVLQKLPELLQLAETVLDGGISEN